MTRDTWAEYFFGICHAVSQRATCNRGKCAAITVRDKRILTTGYVGAPAGLPHCDDAGHLLRKVTYPDGTVREHCMRSVHAEANAIAQAAKVGISLDGARLYTTMFPCFDCAKLIVSAGVTQIYAEHDYHGSEPGQQLFQEAGIHFIITNKGEYRY